MNLFENNEKELKIAALDELFAAVRSYRSSQHYFALIKFIAKLPKYSPFNCFLLHTQNPEVSYVATANQWQKRFGRRVKDEARPLVILAPMSPVLFVFDVVDTEGDPLPENLLNPFETRGSLPNSVWSKTTENLPRDRILLIENKMHSSKAGWIMKARPGDCIPLENDLLPAKYRMQVNSILDGGARYATLIHELAHLYCGHLGTPNEKWWPDRSTLEKEQVEFEAESVCWLICERAGIKNPSDAYLSGYLKTNQEIPEISLDRILKVAGQIEQMGKRKLKPRKKEE